MEQKSESDIARPKTGRAFLHQRLKEMLPDRKGHLVFWLPAVVGLGLDLWTKQAVFEWLQHRRPEGFPVINSFLTLVTAVNDGAVFGFASGQRFLLVAVSIIAMVIIFSLFLFSGDERRVIQTALGFFAAGVAGNLYDRLFNDGLVRDFIDVLYWPGRHWPAFNVADSLLCIGAVIIIFSELLIQKLTRKRALLHK